MTSRWARKALLNLAGIVVALITLFPVLWMISTAFKPATEIYSLTPHPVPLHPTLANFQAVISGSVIGLPYWNFLKNSLFVTIVAVALSSLIALVAAIGLARFRFRFHLPASLSPEAITGLLRGELGFDGVVICDALEMRAASAASGIPEAAVLAVTADVDLLCLGRDTDEEMYHAVRSAIADAAGSGRLTGARLEESADRVARLRAWLARARAAAPGGSASGIGADGGIGLLGARRALRRSGPVPSALVDPLIIEVEPEENIAAGQFTWGFEAWATARRLDPAAGDGAVAHAVLAEAAGRPLVLAVRDAHGAIALVNEVLAARPDTVIVEMGVPAWTPPAGTAYLATHGASRACAQAAAEALGLT